MGWNGKGYLNGAYIFHLFRHLNAILAMSYLISIINEILIFTVCVLVTISDISFNTINDRKIRRKSLHLYLLLILSLKLQVTSQCMKNQDKRSLEITVIISTPYFSE